MMKYLSNVEFRKDLSLTYTGEGLVDKWQRIPILTSDCVKFPEVDTESEAARGFLYE